MIRRDILEQLRNWKNRTDRRPLILRGARQVGKTTVVKEFGREFDTFLSLNLEKRADALLFEKIDDVSRLIDEIYIHLSKRKSEGTTLLFIDEIQCSPAAIAMLRYFYEEAPQMHVIAAGSLLENLINVHASFPVGRVEYMALRPCSFMEYLNGTGQEADAEIIKERQVNTIHDRLSRQFRQYAIMGGMPAVISRYAENNDMLSADHIYESLLTSYRDDAGKYARNETQRHILAHILRAGWAEVGSVIAMDGFAGMSYKSREVGEALRTVERAMLLELVYPAVEAKIPILPNMRRKPKLIWLDTGLVNYQAGIRKELFATDSVMDMWRGRIAEHITAQELIAYDHNVTAQRYYWARDKKESSAEVDFIIRHDTMAIPIEVKSGHNSKLRSLHSFMEHAPHNIAVRVWDNPISYDTVTTISGKAFTLINIPFYYLSQLHTIIDNCLEQQHNT